LTSSRSSLSILIVGVPDVHSHSLLFIDFLLLVLSHYLCSDVWRNQFASYIF
jgi:hypothetical protein